MGCVDKKIPCSKNTLLLKKENSTPEHLVFSKIKHSIMLLKKQGKSRHRETPAAPKLPASLYACFLVKGLGNFKPTDEADVDLFFGEDSYSFNHPVYQVEYSVRSRSSAERSCIGNHFHSRGTHSYCRSSKTYSGNSKTGGFTYG